MRPLLFTLILLWLTGTIVPAQQYNFKTWSLEEGLPQSEVTSLAQDKNGYLWIGTMGGLSRFDGFRFYTLTTENGLNSNNTRALFLDRNNILWAGSISQGLCRYDGKNFRNYGEEDGLPAGGIFSINQTPDGKIWLATAHGLAYFHKDRFQLVNKQTGLPARPFTDILVDKKGNLWLATTENGLYRFDGKTATHFTEKDGLVNNMVYTLFETKDGTLWAGNYGGISKLEGNRFVPFRPENKQGQFRYTALAEGRTGSLFIGTDGGGLLRFNENKFTQFTEKNGLSSKHILTILYDREGNLWLGSMGGGLQRFSPNAFLHFPQNGDLPSGNITALARSQDNNIWLGTIDGGVARYDNHNFKWFTQIRGLAGNRINHLQTDRNGNLWLASDKGISRFNGQEFRTFTEKDGLVNNQVNFSLPDTANRLWLATGNGLSVFDGQTFRNYRHPTNAEANVILSILKDRQQRYWLGTRAGIYEFRNGKFVMPPEVRKYGLREIITIAQDRKNNLWFGSGTSGLLRYSPAAKANRTDHFNHRRGLLSDGIKSLRIDSLQNLWIGTTNGVNRLSLKDHYQTGKFQPKAYTFAEGFKGIEVNPNAILEAEDGKVWFGTIKGLTLYRPQLDLPDTCKPLVNLTGIRLFQQKTDWSSLGKRTDPESGLPLKLELRNTQNHLTFDFQGIYLTNPVSLTYSYMLEGFDKTWSEPTREPIATYSNLEPGNYNFRIKACTKEGNCNAKPVAYAFAIVPPFWTTERITLAWVLLAALAAVGFVRWREQNLKRLNMLLEENVEQRTRMLEKENQEKEILLKEVHHRVKNNLQIITSLLNLQTRHVHDPAALDTLREIKDRIKSISMLHQRLYQREELAAIDLSEYVKTLCRSLFASYGVREDHVRLQFDIPTLYLDIDTALTLGLIVNELVSNTLKYAFPEQRKGTLLIELLRVTETNYTLTISDDGTGLPDNFEEKMGASFGLQLVASLVKKLHGTLKFYSQEGTQIRLQFVILPQ
ncbi:MAG TPA: two-component regulator propeller domain-containing protein [Adhaeribacter sp.]|nr:two-component regulator propeller domain-containing protein [Adhaeribacter sp.]